MCSSVHKAFFGGGGGTVNRRVKVEQGEWTWQAIPIPEPALEYNKYMGGVDLSDALIGYYSVLHKTRKWYKKLFQHLLDIAIVNAFILHKEQMKALHLLPLTQKEFREKLMQEHELQKALTLCDGSIHKALYMCSYCLTINKVP